MKSTSCIKKDVVLISRFTERFVTYPASIKFNNSIYSHSSLNQYEGTKVAIVKGKDCLRVYDTRRKYICTAEKVLNLPKPKRNAAEEAKEEEPYTMQIHKSLERIRESKLTELGLFELSICALMPDDVFREIKKRLELARTFLRAGEPDNALYVVERLLANPQETRTAKGGEL